MMILTDQTFCDVCQERIEDLGDAVVFSDFVVNPEDELFGFNGAIMHSKCLNSHPLGSEALYYSSLSLEMDDRRFCQHCGEIIQETKDVFATGYLTRDSSDELFEYNFLLFHRRHLLSWDGFEAFCEVLKRSSCGKKAIRVSIEEMLGLDLFDRRSFEHLARSRGSLTLGAARVSIRFSSPRDMSRSDKLSLAHLFEFPPTAYISRIGQFETEYVIYPDDEYRCLTCFAFEVENLVIGLELVRSWLVDNPVCFVEVVGGLSTDADPIYISGITSLDEFEGQISGDFRAVVTCS